MAVDSYPLDKADLQKINNGLMGLARAEKVIARAKAAGVPVEAHDNDCAACKAFLEGLKEQFFTRRAADT